MCKNVHRNNGGRFYLKNYGNYTIKKSLFIIAINFLLLISHCIK